ncbi:DnaJ protein ERDJ2A [Linum perenne]
MIDNRALNSMIAAAPLLEKLTLISLYPMNRVEVCNNGNLKHLEMRLTAYLSEIVVEVLHSLESMSLHSLEHHDLEMICSSVLPVRKTDDEPLQKLFKSVRSELNFDSKNTKQEQAKFWKQHPSVVKAELLIQAQLTCELAALPPALQRDFKRVLELSPRLLDELIKMAVIPRKGEMHGWLRLAIGVIELSQCITQAVPLSTRKSLAFHRLHHQEASFQPKNIPRLLRNTSTRTGRAI